MLDLTDAPPWVLYVMAGIGLLGPPAAYGSAARRFRRRARRAAGGGQVEPGAAKPAGRRRRFEDLLTFVAAALATAVTSQGMWRVFEDRLGMPLELRVATFAFLEVAMLVCAVRARSNVTDPKIGKAGQEGAAVWALAGLSAFIAATDSASWHEAVLRLVAPLAAAWLWERGLHVQRSHSSWTRRRWTGRFAAVNWRVTPERVLVRLGLAEPTERTAGQVDAYRRLNRVARAVRDLRRLRHTRGRRRRRAERRLERLVDQLIGNTAYVEDRQLQDALTVRLGALFHATTLAELQPRAPWTPEPDRAERICCGRSGAAGTVPLRIRVAGARPRTLFPVPPEQPPSATVRSLRDRIRQEKADHRYGVRNPDRTGQRPGGGAVSVSVALPAVADLAAVRANEVQPEVQGLAVGTRSGPLTYPVPDLAGAWQVRDLLPGRVMVPDVPDRSESKDRTEAADRAPEPGSRVSAHRAAPSTGPAGTGTGDGGKSETRTARTGTGRTGTGEAGKRKGRAKADPLERLGDALAEDRKYLIQHGRHIPSEKLREALRISKPTANILTKHIRNHQTAHAERPT